eukprot:scaffold65525_cov28-Tisochrysis_lutea.AAC.1
MHRDNRTGSEATDHALTPAVAASLPIKNCCDNTTTRVHGKRRTTPRASLRSLGMDYNPLGHTATGNRNLVRLLAALS